MGGGISFDTNSFNPDDFSERYYCHTCYIIFGDNRNNISLSNNMNCPHCQSNVTEKMINLPTRDMLISAVIPDNQSVSQRRNTSNVSTIHRRYYDGVINSPMLRYMDQGNLTANQASRLNRATVMLQSLGNILLLYNLY